MKNVSVQDLTIIRWHKKGISIREIARRLSLSKYQVEKSLQKRIKPKDSKSPSEILLEPYRDQILQLLEAGQLTVHLIYNRLKEKKIQISESTLKRYIRALKKSEVYVHVETRPGQECQIDFGYLGKFMKDSKPVKVWVLCQVLSFSRYAFHKVVTDQTSYTFFQCQVEAMEFFGGVPRTLKIDNLGAGVLQADFYQPLIQKQYAAFIAHYKTSVIPCRICRGQDKGIVESGVKYVKNNFLKNLETKDLSELEAQLVHWNKTVCNLREHGATRLIPNEQFHKLEKRKLLPLPVKRYERFRYEMRTVNQFGHIYFQYNQYSVPSQFAGESLLISSNGRVLKIFKGDLQVAMHLVHPRKGHNITEDHHQPFHKRAKTAEYYRQKLAPIGDHALSLLDKLMQTHVYEWKRMCNGIHNLGNKYPKALLNLACYETLVFYQADYRKLKANLEKIIEDEQTKTQTKIPLLGVKGYAHYLKIYDNFETRFTE